MDLKYFLTAYLKERPLFLSLIRAKEAYLYQKSLPFKKPILDVGCGDGMFAKITFAKMIDIGLDLKESRIEEAKKQKIYKKFITYDGRHIPMPARSFATVVSNCVLEHVEDIEHVLKEIYRVMKPGGLFLTTVMAKPWEEHLFGSVLMGNSYKDWMRKKQVHLNLFSSKKWTETFQRAGFTIQESEGYLSPAACRLIDICHYLSLPSLFSYILFKRWVLFPRLSSIYPQGLLVRILSEGVRVERGGAIFFILQRQ